MLTMVGLEGYNDRMPHQLSGGQQQRVQLARSLVLESSILLLDEPLAALDEKLRKSMCIELKRIQDRVGITFIHVTHNQEEAMTVADEIAVMADGELVESAGVREIYQHPKRRFTADFIGESAIFEAKVEATNGAFVDVDTGFATITVPVHDATVSKGDTVWVSVRSEVARVLNADVPRPDQHQSLPVTFVDDVYLGFVVNSLVTLPDGRDVYARTPSNEPNHQLSQGDPAQLVWHVDHGRLHTE
jgi:ABC-type Fe3+/spermidine/putrescine transport system ATPase subunit